MYIEKRHTGKRIKYYLVHSYRDINNKVNKIKRFLGTNLTTSELAKLRQRAEEIINAQIEESKTEVFKFSLSEKEIKKLNKLNDRISIYHLKKTDWEAFTEDFVYNTNAIEGSTVLLSEVKGILKKKETSNAEEIETKGVADAVQFIRKTKEEFSLELMKKLHKLCFSKSKSFAGKFRNVEVVIRSGKGEIVHQGVPVPEIIFALKEMIGWYDKNKKKFRPIVLAAIIHNQFEHIHPFQDGNGRVGRLLLNFILLKNSYPPINILLKDRREYYNTLQEYSRYKNLKPTLKFLINQYKKTLKQVATERNKA